MVSKRTPHIRIYQAVSRCAEKTRQLTEDWSPDLQSEPSGGGCGQPCAAPHCAALFVCLCPLCSAVSCFIAASCPAEPGLTNTDKFSSYLAKLPGQLLYLKLHFLVPLILSVQQGQFAFEQLVLSFHSAVLGRVLTHNLNPVLIGKLCSGSGFAPGVPARHCLVLVLFQQFLSEGRFER